MLQALISGSSGRLLDGPKHQQDERVTDRRAQSEIGSLLVVERRRKHHAHIGTDVFACEPSSDEIEGEDNNESDYDESADHRHTDPVGILESAHCFRLHALGPK